MFSSRYLQINLNISKSRSHSSSKYLNALADKPPPFRRRLDKNRSTVLSHFKELLEVKDITIQVYIKYVIKSYNFECLELKKTKAVDSAVSSRHVEKYLKKYICLSHINNKSFQQSQGG